MTDLERVGLAGDSSVVSNEAWIRDVNFKLAAIGCPTVELEGGTEFNELAGVILAHHLEGSRTEEERGAPVDLRIETWLNGYIGQPLRLPRKTFILDKYGLARVLSLPVRGHQFNSSILTSYRVKQGVLHNPRSDRRTTQGIFHITEGGLPIPDDKCAVPKAVFGKMFQLALQPPPDLLRLPISSEEPAQAECFISLLLRPVVSPEVRGWLQEKAMEVRFFAPGTLASNLDFVESIFGNAGDPHLPGNDAALDPDHWTGHTGCVILAPHLVTVTKKSLGLPRFEDATERQRRDGMCWKNEADLYNNGGAFKLTARDAQGVIVTIIADNYFGYCKKEVKTQISYSANLYGMCEEEHAGGAHVFASYDLGEEFSGHLHVRKMGHTFDDVLRCYGSAMIPHEEGYGVDVKYPDIYYVPEGVHFNLTNQTVSWERGGKTHKIKLLAGVTYIRPSGYRVHMEKTPGTKTWRLVGTVAEGIFCHKPCTVSGGGKSEISKPISDAILQGPVFVADFKRDFDKVARLVNDTEAKFKNRFRDPSLAGKDARGVLSPERSLGSVIKLLTPSPAEYTNEYNDWLVSIPQHIKELVFVLKRYYKPEWGSRWRQHFSVDTINGVPGNELKLENRRLVSHYLRVGYEDDSSWRTFGLRQDFHPAAKIIAEDDISASVVVPGGVLANGATHPELSQKIVKNCEYRLFQRPDDAIHRGYDKQTEQDFASAGNFFSNYEPLPAARAKELIEDAIGFDQFTKPMQDTITAVASARPSEVQWFVSNAHPRMVEGKPSKNPRYLQVRPDITSPREVYLTDMATRLFRKVALHAPLFRPVGAVLPGRRNNGPDAAAGIRALSVYNPVHFMELPELFMEFICSMTGKSPSTTGAGSEGALTKGPFNALPPIYDLNAALVSYLLTGHNGFVTAAGYVGPKRRVDHDVSLLIPELWSRMSPEERDPAHMIQQGYLERCVDFEQGGRKVLASRLGWRITPQFVVIFFGRLFNHPNLVFTPEMLRPELQDPAVFADSMDNIAATQERVAENYFADGSIELACPPLKALLHIMRHGQWEGKGLDDPGFRAMFTRASLLSSDWYKARLVARQSNEITLWKRHAQAQEEFLRGYNHDDDTTRIYVKDGLVEARSKIAQMATPAFLSSLEGTIGVQPL